MFRFIHRKNVIDEFELKQKNKWKKLGKEMGFFIDRNYQIDFESFISRDSTEWREFMKGKLKLLFGHVMQRNCETCSMLIKMNSALTKTSSSRTPPLGHSFYQIYVLEVSPKCELGYMAAL